MAVKWKLTGDLVDACSCDPGCPCLFYSDPTLGYCNTFFAFHTRSGKYGNVKLDGLNALLVGMTPGNIWKGNWKAALYLDERADTKQREALETIFTGKVGGAPKVLAGLIGTILGMKYAKIEIDARKKHVRIPGVLEFHLEPNLGGDKKAITLSHHPFYPDIATLSYGKSVKTHFSDFGTTLDYAGKDGVSGPFNFHGP